MSKPYEGKFVAGSKVRVKPEAELARFAREWKYHNPLTAEQLAYAGVLTTVKDLGYYHGGDVLYQLDGVPGVWHERCLGAP